MIKTLNNTEVTIAAMAAAIAAGLVDGKQAPELVETLHEGLLKAQATGVPDAGRAYLEDVLVHAPMAQPVVAWTEEACAVYGHALLVLAPAVVILGFAEEAEQLIRLTGELRVIQRNKALCALWAALATVFKMRINPRVFARGLEVIEEVVNAK